MEVVVIDPGISHCGIVHRSGDRYVYCATQDLATFDRSARQLADRVRAFMSFHKDALRNASAVVMERQPICGGGDAVAQLIYQQLRDKVVWVSPHTLHRRFHMQGLSYEGRKERAVDLARAALSPLPGWTRGRQHDMADAFLMCEHYCEQVHAAQLQTETREECKASGFERFRCGAPRARTNGHGQGIRSRFFPLSPESHEREHIATLGLTTGGGR